MQDTFFQFQLPLASLQVRINSFDDNNEKKKLNLPNYMFYSMFQKKKKIAKLKFNVHFWKV